MYAPIESTGSASPRWVLVASVAAGAVAGLLVAHAFSPASHHLYTVAPSVVNTATNVAPQPNLKAQVATPPSAVILAAQPTETLTTAVEPAAAPTSSMWGLGMIGAGAAAVGAALAKLTGPASDVAEEPLGGVSRRRFVAQTALAASLPLLARPAQAEILPDDDDPEMIAAARANRKNKLAAERKLERETTEAKTANTDPRYATLQSAVLRLAVIGRKLEEGSLDFIATGAAAEIKLPELRASVETLSGGNKEAAEVGEAFLAALQGLLAAVNSNATSAARPAFIATVATLKTWCATAGIEKQIVGL